ncbi:MAG: protein-L-isoaspartate O-methyltransferase [Devosiaceae bacterium]|nr:protein-L-isoaspartate O-methyltransferase [Devosiaceae bacterium]
MIDFAHARTEMIEGQIRPSGVFDLRVLDAISAIRREEFLTQKQAEFAYIDKEHVLQSNNSRRMPTPSSTAKLIELAEVEAGDIVLDVACGTGYSTAILAQLANSVVAIESDAGLVEQANAILAEMDISNAAVVQGNLNKGLPSEAPFDVIIIEGAVEVIPEALFDQLRVGGRLAAVVGTGNSATAVLHVKSKSGVTAFPSFNASLPLLSEFAVKPGFSF